MNKAAETAKIPCAVCRDLMPLVQDGVASPESEALVHCSAFSVLSSLMIPMR